MPTAIFHLQLRSGSAHCDLPLAVLVAGEKEEEKEERRRRTLIKSNNPHLEGGEQHSPMISKNHYDFLMVRILQSFFLGCYTLGH